MEDSNTVISVDLSMSDIQEVLTRDGNGTSIPPVDEAPAHESQTAADFISSQLRLEEDAREALPYSFSRCTRPLGALRQNLFACLTCNPPDSTNFQPAAVCYSCSIACHGEHTLVELFARRNFTCDCGSTRLPSTSPCTLRIDPATGMKGPVHGEEAAQGNSYNHNCRNRFCGCGEEYDADNEKGTMFQCLGLVGEDQGGCGEDWWHAECVVYGGEAGSRFRKEREAKANLAELEKKETDEQEAGEDLVEPPPEFPDEDSFDTFICYKCVNAVPWIKPYAGTEGFLPPVFVRDVPTPPSDGHAELKGDASHSLSAGGLTEPPDTNGTTRTDGESITTADLPTSSKKRTADTADLEAPTVASTKKPKSDPAPSSPLQTTGSTAIETPAPSLPAPIPISTTSTSEPPAAISRHAEPSAAASPQPYHTLLPVSAPTTPFSIFCHSDFRSHLCRCHTCYPPLSLFPQLLEEEEEYQPPPSSAASEAGTGSNRSLLERGEAALNNVDRVRAIEGVMAYNHLKDKVKGFLKPFAESGQPVGAEDVKRYFEKLRGDEAAVREAGAKPGKGDVDGGASDEGNGGTGNGEQKGEFLFIPGLLVVCLIEVLLTRYHLGY